jgi:K+-transporting ATPase ATPase C chain
MRPLLLAAVRAVVVLTLLTGVVYPLAVTGVAQLAFEDEADGSLVRRDGAVVGSRLLGQGFSGDEYFHGRPSAAPPGVSGPSNLGPTNPDLLAEVERRVAAYRARNGLRRDQSVPVDAVTASASGLDPHISVANARLQAPRVARARGLDPDRVQGLIDRHTSGRTLGFLGEKGVRVLTLNLALDEIGHDDGR